MPRTKRGWIGGLEPLNFMVSHFRNHVIFALLDGEGFRVAIELSHDQAEIVALIGRQDENRPPVLDAEFEVSGKLFVSDSPVEATCEPMLDTWDGPLLPLRMQFEEQPQRLLWSVRDPENQRGFILKMTERARGTLFSAISQTGTVRVYGKCSIEGDLEVVQ